MINIIRTLKLSGNKSRPDSAVKLQYLPLYKAVIEFDRYKLSLENCGLLFERKHIHMLTQILITEAGLDCAIIGFDDDNSYAVNVLTKNTQNYSQFVSSKYILLIPDINVLGFEYHFTNLHGANYSPNELHEIIKQFMIITNSLGILPEFQEIELIEGRIRFLDRSSSEKHELSLSEVEKTVFDLGYKKL